MADDDPNSRNEQTQPISPEEIEELVKLPEFPDREEFVKTIEMDSAARDTMTRPTQPTLDDTTQRYEVPQAIMDLARRSQILSLEKDWVEFSAVVDDEGTIVVPEDVRKKIRSGAIIVRVKLQ